MSCETENAWLMEWAELDALTPDEVAGIKAYIAGVVSRSRAERAREASAAGSAGFAAIREALIRELDNPNSDLSRALIRCFKWDRRR